MNTAGDHYLDERRWYNTEHLHSAIGLATPEERHHGHDIAILAAQRETYAAAEQRNPRRWSRKARAWHRPTSVTLNPDRVVVASPKSHAA